jgi:hypothetical protein
VRWFYCKADLHPKTSLTGLPGENCLNHELFLSRQFDDNEVAAIIGRCDIKWGGLEDRAEWADAHGHDHEKLGANNKQKKRGKLGKAAVSAADTKAGAGKAISYGADQAQHYICCFLFSDEGTGKDAKEKTRFELLKTTDKVAVSSKALQPTKKSRRQEGKTAIQAEAKEEKPQPKRRWHGVTCPHCGGGVSFNAKTCKSCGKKIVPQTSKATGGSSSSSSSSSSSKSAANKKVRWVPDGNGGGKYVGPFGEVLIDATPIKDGPSAWLEEVRRKKVIERLENESDKEEDEDTAMEDALLSASGGAPANEGGGMSPATLKRTAESTHLKQSEGETRIGPGFQARDGWGGYSAGKATLVVTVSTVNTFEHRLRQMEEDKAEEERDRVEELQEILQAKQETERGKALAKENSPGQSKRIDQLEPPPQLPPQLRLIEARRRRRRRRHEFWLGGRDNEDADAGSDDAQMMLATEAASSQTTAAAAGTADAAASAGTIAAGTATGTAAGTAPPQDETFALEVAKLSCAFGCAVNNPFGRYRWRDRSMPLMEKIEDPPVVSDCVFDPNRISPQNVEAYLTQAKLLVKYPLGMLVHVPCDQSVSKHRLGLVTKNSNTAMRLAKSAAKKKGRAARKAKRQAERAAEKAAKKRAQAGVKSDGAGRDATGGAEAREAVKEEDVGAKGGEVAMSAKDDAEDEDDDDDDEEEEGEEEEKDEEGMVYVSTVMDFSKPEAEPLDPTTFFTGSCHR